MSDENCPWNPQRVPNLPRWAPAGDPHTPDAKAPTHARRARSGGLWALVLIAGIGVALPARAQVAPTASGGNEAQVDIPIPPSIALDPALTLDPSAPQTGALPGGVTPAFGQKSLSEDEWRFDFHGFLTAPLNAGIGSRVNPMPGQSHTTLHSPPVVPDDLETFSHTGVVPTTYAQINFSEGNSVVTGLVSIVAKQANASTSFLEPASQLGVTDVFVSITPPIDSRLHLQALVGAFTSRFGATGEFDEGRYGTPLIARISGVGEQATAKIGFGDLTLILVEGIHGQSNKASQSITVDAWNNFADPGAGSSFVAHGHVGVGWRKRATLGAHFLRAFSMDDRAGTSAPDGRINIFAADARVNAGRFGHLYLAYSYTDALQARAVSRIISVLNAPGGLGLMQNYFGLNSGGTGTLGTLGFQYDLSIGKLVSYPIPFSGDGPDLFVSVFGMFTHVTSADPGVDPATANVAAGVTGHPWSGADKRKVGLEATYSVLPWLATSLRYDRVDPLTDDAHYSFAVVSPRVILRTDWQATDQIVIQYSHWFNGSNTLVRTGDPPMVDPAQVPDGDMLSISASMWW